MVEFHMPPVRVGDTVYHYQQAGIDKYSAAIVTAVYERTITAHVFSENQYNSVPVGAIRHRRDPDRRVENESGYWDYGPTHEEIQELRQEVRALQEQVRTLQEVRPQLAKARP